MSIIYYVFVLHFILDSGYSEVKTFLTKAPSVIDMYKLITTSLNKTISLTGSHLLYVRKANTEKFSQM